MDQQKIFIAILGMAVVTYLPRFLPLWVLSTRQLPQIYVDWLRFVPAAVMASMLLPSLMLTDGRLNIHTNNLFLLAALPTFLFALKTRHFFGTIVVGMISVGIGRFIVGS